MARSLLMLSLLAACRTNPLDVDPVCGDHADARSCAADPACEAVSCPSSCGGTTFTRCVAQGTNTAACSLTPCVSCEKLDASACAAAGSRCRAQTCCGVATCVDANSTAGCGGACVDCHNLPEQTCLGVSYCRAAYCNVCGSVGFSCLDAGEPGPSCPAVPCAQACSAISDADMCNQRSDCHAVYSNHELACDCAGAGCCTFFDHCADGPAVCDGKVTCRAAPPTCDGPYSVGTDGVCYEGCVLTSKCQ